MNRRSRGFWGACFACFLAARASDANGRYPTASQLVIDPHDATHLVARTTFGVLDSVDDGASWQWICENAIGYVGMEDPSIAVATDGTTIAASSAGITTSAERSCAWRRNPGLNDAPYGVDVTVVPARAHELLALVASSIDKVYTSRLIRTVDDGDSFVTVGSPFERTFVGETVEVAPSEPDRVYVSGRVIAEDNRPLGSAVARSDDGGLSWTRYMVAGTTSEALFIGAVDPRDPDLVYIRTRTETNSRVLVSRDGAQTWTELWRAPSAVLGFALSGDGTTLAVGSPVVGVHLASTDAFAFSRVSTVGAECLTWHGTQLLACANEALDGFMLGASNDGGKHFRSLLHQADLSPRACPETTEAGRTCPGLWPAIASVIGAEQGTVATGGDAAADAPTASPGGDDSDARASGCSCRTASAATGVLPWTFFAGLLVALAARRRTARTAATHARARDLKEEAR